MSRDKQGFRKQFQENGKRYEFMTGINFDLEQKKQGCANILVFNLTKSILFSMKKTLKLSLLFSDKNSEEKS